ncbi:class I SAM-dependent methyltransferase [Hydromonas duriensis]|uniref:Methyltransferase family protein n=1 Tax=Hydromonas duriensis TaxID=1527608 RepID=A0A4R6Y1E5_9BURK|nr:methyltransferase domain-containing protein [Hydromonas duriensis]TDR30194.1 methyltransferase family protein [Hydromonas duriensis]
MTQKMDWNGTAGRYITAWETQLLNQWVADAFGFYAAQLGHTTRINALLENRCAERWAIEVGEAHFQEGDSEEIKSVEVGDFTVLPFASDSMDLLVLPHTLDDHPEPHAVLREAYRVLRPEGRMIILGFNPFSLWGAKAMFRRWRGQPWWAYRHQAIHIRRLKDWLQLLNCDVAQGKFGCYAPCTASEKRLSRSAWLEDAGDRWWGMAGAVYAMMAVKRVYSPTLVGLINDKKTNSRWAAQPALNKATQTATEKLTQNTHP